MSHAKPQFLRGGKTLLNPLALAVLLTLGAATTSLHAQQTARSYDIPAGQLDATLTQIARETGVIVSFSPELVAGKRSAPVQGSLDARTALRQALAGTGLELATAQDGTLTLRKTAQQPAVQAAAGSKTLGLVKVEASALQGVDRDMIEKMPNRTGSMEDALRILPQVQFDDASQRSTQGGEIKPPLIAISGGKPYENAYVIDGLSNNNYVAPPIFSNNGRVDEPNYQDTPGENNDVPIGMSQSYNLNKELLDGVELLDSRIPVQYSGFTGGVVSAVTKKPFTEKVSGNIYWRHSRSDWEKLLYDPRMLREGEKYEESYSASRQSKFIRNTVGINLNVPINERLAAIVSYDLTHSRIPLLYTPGGGAGDYSKDQTREAHTLFGSIGGNLGEGLEANLKGVYYKYNGNYYSINAINSEYDYAQENFDLALDLSKKLDGKKINFKAKYADLSSRRDSQSNVYLPWQTYGDKDWGYPGAEPGSWGTDISTWRYGWMSNTWGYSVDGISSDDLDWKQRTFNASLSGELDAIDWGGTQHTLSAGLSTEMVWANAVSGGKIGYNGNFVSLLHPLAPGQDAVAYNWDRTNGQLYDMYLSTKDVYDPYDRSASTKTVSVWLQDQIDLGNFKLTPGIRLDYDDQYQNYNFAPRFAASWNLGGQDNTIIHAGVARYYGGPSLYYNLYKTMGFTRYNRPDARDVKSDGLVSWGEGKWNNYGAEYDARDMKTPYSDEFSLGLDWKLQGGFALDYNFVYREGKDGIMQYTAKVGETEAGRPITQRMASNAGRSRYTGHTLSIANSYLKNHYFRIGTNWADSTSNYIDYLSGSGFYSYRDAADGVDNSRVIYNGELIDHAKLDMSKFNRPMQIVGYWQGRFGDRFDLASTVTYRRKAPILVSEGRVKLDDGWRVRSFSRNTLPSSVTVDMTLGWDALRHKDQTLRLTVDVFNVFNRKIVNGKGMYYGSGNVPMYYDYYASGRSFMARVDYKF